MDHLYPFSTHVVRSICWEDIEDEAERLLEMRRVSQDATTKDNDNGEQEYDQEAGGDEAEKRESVVYWYSIQ
jgi:hypothetical protein